MGEIKDYVRLYIEDSDILEDTAKEISLDLRANIKEQLYEGHGYVNGNLRRNIRTDMRIYKNYAIIIGYYDENNADYGKYVLAGIRGKAEVKPIDFLGDGLKATLRAYS